MYNAADLRGGLASQNQYHRLLHRATSTMPAESQIGVPSALITEFGAARRYAGNPTEANDVWNGTQFVDITLPTTYAALVMNTGATASNPRIVKHSEQAQTNLIAGMSLDSTNRTQLRTLVRTQNNTLLYDQTQSTQQVTTDDLCLVVSATNPDGTDEGWMGSHNYTTGVTLIDNLTQSNPVSGNGLSDRFEVGGWDQGNYGFPGVIYWACSIQQFISREVFPLLIADPWGPFRTFIPGDPISGLAAGVYRRLVVSVQ